LLKPLLTKVIDYPASMPDPPSPPILAFDPEWLAITRAFAPYLTRTRQQADYPPEAEARAAVATELAWVRENVVKEGDEKEVGSVMVFEKTVEGGKGVKGRGQRESCIVYLLTL
jgi:lariat debranching enzyme